MSPLEEGRLIGLSIAVLWFGWILSWWLAARWYAPVKARAGLLRQLPDRLLVIMGAVLVGFSPPPGLPSTFMPLTARLFSYGFTTAWVLVGFIAFGIAIMWWARLYLGRLWSGTVTKKEDHRIIDTGPYGLVRHPIYTGLLIAFYATALLRDSWLALIGAALVTLGLYLKARLEERFLSQDLGPEYAAYRARVPMLVPFLGV